LCVMEVLVERRVSKGGRVEPLKLSRGIFKTKFNGRYGGGWNSFPTAQVRCFENHHS
jgi:hypothetical protein